MTLWQNGQAAFLSASENMSHTHIVS